MRKVYVSFLGTNNYIPCNYVCEGREPVKNVRFVQEATLSWHCADWNKQDEIFIFSTEEAYKKNWVDDGHQDRDGNVVVCAGLASRIFTINISARVSEVHIPSGKNEREIWDLFSTVFEKIREGDELYFDITHAFRSLPLLAMVIINYAKIIKKIQVNSIEYGAMEAIGTSWQVKQMDIESRNVPVFNLLPFDQLLDWSTAIDRFIGAGDAGAVQQLTTRNITPILSKSKGQNQEASGLRDMAKYLGQFSKTLATCRGRNIVKNAAGLKQAITLVQDQKLVQPLAPLLSRLEKAVEDFSGNEVQDGVAASRWCLEHNLLQQGFTILQETMLTHVLAQATDEDPLDIKKRNIVNKAVNIELNDIHFEKWDEVAKENKQLIKQVRDWLRPQKDLLDCMRNLTSNRNDLNHAGMNTNPMSADKFEVKLKDYLDTFESLIPQNTAI